MIGHLERAIEANTHNSDDTDGITTPYDVTDPKNIQYLKNVMDLMKKITPAMKRALPRTSSAERCAALMKDLEESEIPAGASTQVHARPGADAAQRATS